MSVTNILLRTAKVCSKVFYIISLFINEVTDVHQGIYAIFQKNLITNGTETLVNSFPGGASRPELSRDRRTLAFVRRVRDKEALVLKYASQTPFHFA